MKTHIIFSRCCAPALALALSWGFAMGAWAQVSVAPVLQPSASTLSLTQAMREAMQRYPAVRASQAQRAFAVADVDKAEAARWPVLGVGATAMQQGTSGASTRSATPQASYAVYAGGSIEAGVDRAQQLLRAADGKSNGTRDDVAQQSGEAYLLWARALDQMNLARENHQILSQVRDDVATIVEVDRGRQVDLNQAQVRLKAAALTVSQREVDFEQARWRLARYVASVSISSPVGLDTMPGQWPASLAQALQSADDRHPLMAQALAQLEAARSGVTIAQAALRPRVDLTVSRQINPYSLSSQTLSQLSVNMPVFNGGAGQASVRGAVEQLQAAQSGLEEQSLVLSEKISLAWSDWQQAGQRVVLSADQARTGADLVENYRAQFRLARRSLLDLLNVQNEVYGYQAAALQAVFDERIAKLKLLAAMGQLALALDSSPAQ